MNELRRLNIETYYNKYSSLVCSSQTVSSNVCLSIFPHKHCYVLAAAGVCHRVVAGPLTLNNPYQLGFAETLW